MLGMASPLAASATTYCTGKLTHVWLDATGKLLYNATFRNDHVQICNINQPWNNVSAETCKQWRDMLTKGYLANSTFTIAYYDDPRFNNCANIPNYVQAPAPWYVMLNN
jgi:hypothetical protein